MPDLNWKPKQKCKQVLIINNGSKLIVTMELEMQTFETSTDNKEIEQKENSKEEDRLKWNIFLVNIDDVLIYSKTFEEHLRDLEEIFNRLIEANMQLKPSKCHLFQRQLIYLGHQVSSEGIQPDPTW